MLRVEAMSPLREANKTNIIISRGANVAVEVMLSRFIVADVAGHGAYVDLKYMLYCAKHARRVLTRR